MNDATENRLSIQLVDSVEDLRELEPQWVSLLQNSQASTVFLSWHWQWSWVNCFLNNERKLFIVCVRKGNDIVAIAPWYIENHKYGLLHNREVHFLGGPESGSDYLDVIIQEGHEKITTRAIYDFLHGLGRHHWDELRLNDQPAESLFLLHFMNCINDDRKYAEMACSAYLPQTALPNNSDDFLSALSSNRRYIYRRDSRRLDQEGEVSHRIFTQDTTAAGMDAFFPLYDTKSGYKDGPKLRNFLEHLCTQRVPRDWLQLDMLYVDEKPVAGLLHLKYDQKLAMLKMVVDKSFSKRISLGNLLVGKSIANAINEGLTCYDFLKGDEEYKFHWTKKGRVMLSTVHPQRRFNTSLISAYRLIKYYGKIILR